jgi:hypothetical protein
MTTIHMLAVCGLLIALIGVGNFGKDARPLAWGLAIVIGVLTAGMRSLQKQIDELRTASGNPAAKNDANPQGCDET